MNILLRTSNLSIYNSHKKLKQAQHSIIKCRYNTSNDDEGYDFEELDKYKVDDQKFDFDFIKPSTRSAGFEFWTFKINEKGKKVFDELTVRFTATMFPDHVDEEEDDVDEVEIDVENIENDEYMAKLMVDSEEPGELVLDVENFEETARFEEEIQLVPGIISFDTRMAGSYKYFITDGTLKMTSESSAVLDINGAMTEFKNIDVPELYNIQTEYYFKLHSLEKDDPHYQEKKKYYKRALRMGATIINDVQNELEVIANMERMKEQKDAENTDDAEISILREYEQQSEVEKNENEEITKKMAEEMSKKRRK